MQFRSGNSIAGLALASAAVTVLAGCLAQSPFVARASQPHGVVTGLVERSAENLYAVEIDEINGKRVDGSRRGTVWLEPGRYTIKTTGATVKEDFTPSAGRISRPRVDGAGIVEIDVEAGKTYYVALDTSSTNKKDWRTVVWRVEPGGERPGVQSAESTAESGAGYASQ